MTTQPATTPAPDPSAAAPTAPAAPAFDGALPQDSAFKLPSLADQVRAETERLKAEARAKKGTGGAAGRDESGRFKADEDEARAAREDGDSKRRAPAGKAREVDDDKAAEAEARELEKAGAGGEDDDADAETKADASGDQKPRGEPKAARWRVKLKRGEERLAQMQRQIVEQSRAIAEQQRQIEQRAKDLEAKASRVGELEALEQGLSSDPLDALYARKIDPETLVLRHYERMKNGGQPSASQPGAGNLPPEVKKALEEVAELRRVLAEREAKQTEAQKVAELDKAKAHFLSQVTETEYPDLDAYRDLRGDEDVVLSAFGPDGTAHWLEARLGRQPTHAEVLRQLNKDAGTWLAQRKVAKRFGERKTPDSDREPEPRTAAEPEGAKPTSKTLSNRRVSSGTPAPPPDFGDRSVSSRFLVDALARGRTRLVAWRYPHSGRSERAARLPWSLRFRRSILLSKQSTTSALRFSRTAPVCCGA